MSNRATFPEPPRLMSPHIRPYLRSVVLLSALAFVPSLASAQALGLEVDLHGSGTVRAQLPVPGSRVQPGAHVALRLAR